MAKVNVGVVGQAQLNAGMSALNSGDNTSQPITWSAAWFLVSVAFILFIYFGFGGLRGAVAS
jgi:hypothetical protein